MKKISLLLLACFTLHAQTPTAVTATVTGADGSPYANGTYTATLSNASGQPIANVPGSFAATPRVLVSGSLDATGTLAVSLLPNASIVTGSQWVFRVCSGSVNKPSIEVPQKCFTAAATITGSTQSLSAQFSALAPSISVSLPAVTLPIDPVLPMQAATKQYVDAKAIAGGATSASGAPGRIQVAGVGGTFSSIPAVISALGNDSGFQTSPQVQAAITALALGTASGHAAADFDAAGAANTARLAAIAASDPVGSAATAQTAAVSAANAASALAIAALNLDTASTKAAVTVLGSPGLDSNIPTEKAVRAAIATAGAGGLQPPVAAGVLLGAPGSTVTTRGVPDVDFQSAIMTNVLTHGSLAQAITDLGSTPTVLYVPATATGSVPGSSVLQNTFYGDNNLWGSPCTTPGNFAVQDGRYKNYTLCNGVGNSAQSATGLIGVNGNIYYDQHIVPNGHYNGFVTNVTIADGGTNYSGADGSIVDKSTYNGTSVPMQVATSGQSIASGSRIVKTGLGDSFATGLYSIDYGGCPSQGDECNKAINAGAMQGNSEFTGTIVGTPAVNAELIFIAAVSGAPFQGQDRELINTTTGSQSIVVTSIANSTTDGSVLNIAAGGIAPVIVRGTLGTAAITAHTPTVFTPTLTLGSMASITTSTLICAVERSSTLATGAYDFERIRPSAVTGTTMTISFARPKSAATTFTVGGACGMDLVMSADSQTNASFASLFTGPVIGTLDYAIPVIDSTANSITLYTAGFGHWLTYSGANGFSQWTVTNNAATLYHAAQVKSVMSGGAVGLNWQLYPNTITWNASDTLIETQYFSQKHSVGNFIVQQLTPSPVSQPLVGFSAYGIMGPNSLGIALNNPTLMSYYSLFGQPIAGLSLQGAWNSGLYMLQEPGTAAVTIHCAACTTGNYDVARVFSGSTGGNIDEILFDKANQQFEITAGNRFSTYIFGKNGLTTPKSIFTAAGAAFVGPNAGGENPAFSATPTFSAATRSSVIALTGNVTAFSIAAGAQDGQEKVIVFCQPATGGPFTVATPTFWKNFQTISATANACTAETATWSLTQSAWIGEDTSGSGGSGGTGSISSGTLAARPATPASPTVYIATDQPRGAQFSTWDGTNWTQLQAHDGTGQGLDASGNNTLDPTKVAGIAAANHFLGANTHAASEAFTLGVTIPPALVSALPAASTLLGGVRTVSDALSPAAGVTIVGGGATFRPVISDGTSWKSLY